MWAEELGSTSELKSGSDSAERTELMSARMSVGWLDRHKDEHQHSNARLLSLLGEGNIYFELIQSE